MAEVRDATARLEELLSPRGRELLDRLKQEDVTPDTALAVSERLRAHYPAELVREALAQHELRMRAEPKFSRAGQMFFTRAGLEQASAELVARHRASRYPDAEQVADLCCGIGGDLIALAASHPVLAVDHDRLHLRMAQANAEAYGVASRVTTLLADVRDADLNGVRAVFIDPARRTDRGRLRAGDSQPPLDWCVRLADRVGRVAIKAAPGLPHEAVPPGWELEFVALGRELKEAVAWSPAQATAARRATILPAGDELVQAPGDEPGDVRPPGEFLFDPNPAVTRAGLVRELGAMIGAWQIDRQIAFLSADSGIRTPFARVLRVIDSGPWQQKRLPARLRALDIGSVDIRRRGLAGDVELLRRQLRLSGSRRATLVMTRVNDRPWALVCVDAGQSR
jgi:SAM-dependent methyltransferase